MFERFTDRARRSLTLAQEQAVFLGHDFIGTEHMLLGLAVERDGVGGRILQEVGLDEDTLRAEVGRRMPPGAALHLRPEDGDALAELGIDLAQIRERVESSFGEGALPTARTGKVPFTALAKQALESSLRSALALGHNYIGTEHVLLGLARTEGGVAAEILDDVITVGDISERVIMKLRGMGHTG
ncbi:MAG TPA: Clp protease N-terminal domain-containing protein [Acidimicrobiales bacterium]|nr:Clp protease N-terminal domain-containing protein [Acidimicrobiales bacterium]